MCSDPGVCAAFAPSTVWTPVMFLFPFLSPLVRCLAWVFPDSGMLKMKRAAGIIVDIVSANVEQRRQELKAEVYRLRAYYRIREHLCR